MGSVGLSEINERERIKEVQDETEELGVVKEEEEEEEEELLPVKISVSEPQVQVVIDYIFMDYILQCCM